MSASCSALGVIQELDIYDLANSPGFYPLIASGVKRSCIIDQGKGLLHPITVRAKDRHFETVASNRALGWSKILCHVIELDDK